MSKTDDFTVITPKDDVFKEVNKSVELHAQRIVIDYNALADIYNSSPLGSLVFIEGSANSRAANVRTTLKKRGLTPDEDVTVAKPSRDADGTSIPLDERVLVLKKLTDTKMIQLHS